MPAAGDSASQGTLTESDVYPLRSCTLANIRLFDTAFLQVEQGLLDPDALARLGWSNFLGSTFLIRMWPQVRSRVTPEFADYLKAEQPALAGL